MLKINISLSNNSSNQMGSHKTELDKARYSLYSTIVFLIIASPFMFKLVNAILGSIVPIASPSGCPTTAGLLLHSIVFFLIVFGLMHLHI